MDCDAFSVVISTNHMTEVKEAAIADYLFTFGTSHSLSPSAPRAVVGSRKPDDIFGCSGNKCQHLPTFLQGDEMLVLDSPVKIALHKSCKESLKNHLTRSGFPINESDTDGLFFNTNQMARLPSYQEMVKAMIKCCETLGTSTHIIHIADMGFKLKLPQDEPAQEMHKFFNNINKLRDSGVTVEITQIDIAFVAHVRPGCLVQVSTDKRNRNSDSRLITHDYETKKFPLHTLPPFNSDMSVMKKSDLKGTVQLKTKKWDSQDTTRISRDASNDSSDDGSSLSHFDNLDKAVNLYKVASSAMSHTTTMKVHRSDIHNTKIYNSTVASYFLNERNKLHLSSKALYAISNRTMSQLQSTLRTIQNIIGTVLQESAEHGTQLRTEISIRPHHTSPLRQQKCHWVDFMMHVCIAVTELSNKSVHIIKLEEVSIESVRTATMKWISQLSSHLCHRHSLRFKEVFDNDKVHQWLRAMYSLLLITSGVCPVVGVKHINEWIKNTNRYDPHSLLQCAGPTSNILNTTSNFQHMLCSLNQQYLPNQDIPRCDKTSLKNLITGFGDGNKPEFHHPMKAREYYIKFSLKTKLLLPTLINQISSLMARHLTNQTEEVREDTDDDSEIDNTYLEWLHVDPPDMWQETDISDDSNPHPFINSIIEKKDLPTDDLLRAIHLLRNMEIFLDPSYPFFQPMLAHHIILCNNHQQTSKNLPEPIINQLKQCASGAKVLSRDELRKMCSVLNINMVSGNFQKQVFLAHLCTHYSFPCIGTNLLYQCCGAVISFEDRIDSFAQQKQVLHEDINTFISEATSHDFTIKWSNNRYFRNSDYSMIKIHSVDRFMTNNPSTTFCPRGQLSTNPLVAIAETLNTAEDLLTDTLHKEMSKIERIHDFILNPGGTTQDEFKGIKGLKDVEDRHHFKFSGGISTIGDTFTPTVVFPIISRVFETNITFYDTAHSTTWLYTYCDSRVICYEVPQQLNHPRIECHIIISTSHRNNCTAYRWNTISPSNTPCQLPIHEVLIPHPMGLCLPPKNNIRKVLPGYKFVKSKSLIEGALHVLQHIDPYYTEDTSDGDSLGLLEYVNTMAICIPPVTVLNKIFPQGLLDVATSMNTNTQTKWTSEQICALLCLKIGRTVILFEKKKNKKETGIWYFNHHDGIVTHEKHKKYVALQNCTQTVYLYKSDPNISASFLPPTDHKPKHSFGLSIRSRFSFLGKMSLLKVFSQFQQKHNITAFDSETGRQQDLRPDTHTNVMLCWLEGTSHDHMTWQHSMQVGVSQPAMILIFPSQTTNNNETWDCCIIFHPHQHQMDAMNFIKTKLPGTRTEKYMYYTIPGIQPENCEHTYYVILYAFLGHKSSTFGDFKNKIEKLKSLSGLTKNIKQWLFDVIVHKREKVPAWITATTLLKN